MWPWAGWGEFKRTHWEAASTFQVLCALHCLRCHLLGLVYISLRNINYIHKLLQRDSAEPCLASDIIYYNSLWFFFFGFDIVPTFLSHKAFTTRFQKWCAEALPVSCGEQTRASNQRAIVFRPWRSCNNSSSTDIRRSSHTSICSLPNFFDFYLHLRG